MFRSIGGWIQPDTWGVVMNYLSVVMVMILLWGLMRRVIRYFSLQDKPIIYHTAWVILLSWFTSGMGAFLVFVDNKSDFGVLTITLCALLLVFDWLPSLDNDQADEAIDIPHDSLITTKSTIALISGAIAGIAVLAKPTALFDLAITVLVFAGIVAGAWAVVGSGFAIIGLMAIMKITTVPLYISSV